MGNVVDISSRKRDGIDIRVAGPDELTIQGKPEVTIWGIVSVRCRNCGEILTRVDAKIDFSDVPQHLHGTFLNLISQIPIYGFAGWHSDCPKNPPPKVLNPKPGLELAHSSKEKEEPGLWAKIVRFFNGKKLRSVKDA